MNFLQESSYEDATLTGTKYKIKNMATIEEMQSLIVELTSGGPEIPGLDFDTIVDGIAENTPEYKKMLDSAKTPEDRKEIKEGLITYLESTGKATINQSIGIIKSSYSVIVDGVENLTESISTMAALFLLPAALPAAPNPAYSLMQGKQAIGTLSTACNGLLQTFLFLLQAAVSLVFEIPTMLTALLQLLLNLKTVISLIPIP